MTNKEFLNEFDLLYNNILSNSAPGLNEYEISLFLTEAQELLVKEYYTGKNVFRESFERNEEVTRSLSSLIRTEVLTKEYDPEYIKDMKDPVSSSSYFYQVPQDAWFIIREAVKLSDDVPCHYGEYVDVIPVTHDKFSRIMKNPFRKEGPSRVLRLSLENNLVELISAYDIESYLIRYIVQPDPIVLVDLRTLGDYTINGVSAETECKLHPLVHRNILDKAVNIAIAAYKQ